MSIPVKWFLPVVALCLLGCGDETGPAPRPKGRSAKLAAKAALRDAIRAYALADSREDINTCISKLERIAQDTAHPAEAASARFAIGHVHAYALEDPANAIEHFRAVIQLDRNSSIAELAKRQIQAIETRQKAAPQ